MNGQVNGISMNKFLQMSTNEILILTELSDLVQLPLIDRNMNETS